MRILLVGEGAFAGKHAACLKNIEDVEVAALVGGVAGATDAFAREHGIPFWTLDLVEGLTLPGIEAAILATPTPLHATQAIQVLDAGKHVEVEIPMADNIEDSRRIVSAQRKSGLIAMVGHTRRYNPGHQWIHKKINAGELTLQHLVVETFFFRRNNLNAEGKPRSWADHLLWHHACHTVDLFQYQTAEMASEVSAIQGPIHPELGIAMDMSISMKVQSGALCTLSLSFNNEGPFGTSFRYICDNGTYIARYDDLLDGHGNPIDLSRVDVAMNGIELQDRDFVDSIRHGREPRASVASVLPSMVTLDRLQTAILALK